MAGHVILGGASNVAMGGKFQDGFLSAAISAGAGDLGGFGAIQGDSTGAIAGRTIVAGIVGGTASALGGGKFANGAWTAAFQHLLNAELPNMKKGTTLVVMGQADKSRSGPGLFELAAQTYLKSDPTANMVYAESGEAFLEAVTAHYQKYGPISKMVVFAHGSTHALYFSVGAGTSSFYCGNNCHSGTLGRGGAYLSSLNPRFFAEYGYACLYACNVGRNGGIANRLANQIGKGFLVEGNTFGLTFTGVSGGKPGQGLPKMVPDNYKGNVFLQDAWGKGKWNFYRGGN
jgi:hypothetical protein